MKFKSTVILAVLGIGNLVFPAGNERGAALAGSVDLMLLSDRDGSTVKPGERISWEIRARVSEDDNLGLAMISADLVQAPDNPELIDIPQGNGPPEGMEEFDRPSGFTNPNIS